MNCAAPYDVYDTIVSIVTEWGQRSEDVEAGTVDASTQLAASTGHLAALTLRQIAAHRPVLIDGVWVCPSCVEIQPLGFARAAAPCLHLRTVAAEVLGPEGFNDPSTAVLELIGQNGHEAYVEQGALELSYVHGVPDAEARSHASTILAMMDRLVRSAMRR